MIARTLAATAKVATLLQLSLVLAFANAVPARAGPDPAPFVAQEIAPRIHLLSTPKDYSGVAYGNVTVIEQSDGFVLIDGGMTAAHGRTIVAYVRSLSPKPIKAVAITHWHLDHPGGISGIVAAYPHLRIISTRPTEQALLSPVAAYDVGYSPNPAADAAVAARWNEAADEYRKMLSDPATDDARRARINKLISEIQGYIDSFPGTYIAPPTETFEHQLLLDDREFPVRLMFLGRANTAGDLIAWLPRQRIVASGDMVVSPYPFGFGSFPMEWIQALGRLRALGFTTLIPGHGEPQHDASYLDKLIAAITDIRAQTAPLARQGLSLEEVKKKVDLSKTAELFGTGPGAKANFQSLFGEPMTENAYNEALGKPLGIVDPGKVRFTEKAPPSHAVHHKS